MSCGDYVETVLLDRLCAELRETEAQVDANLKRADRLRQSILSQAFTGALYLFHECREGVA